ncbi:MAG TPA: ankyrin repeat domain-containing protein [Rhabdochlamydiaceae bacterium]|nr:ankyrin repeat domain-containing protein [Rhabdochlamydiaceae bacterium]
MDQIFRLLIENLDSNKDPRRVAHLNLDQLVCLLIKILDPNYLQSVGCLKRIQTVFHNFLQSTPLIPAQYHRLSLAVQGLILRVFLNNLTQQQRNQLQQAISQMPPSLSRLFELANLSIEEVIQRGDLESFYILVYAWTQWCFAEDVAKAGQSQKLRALLAMGSIGNFYRNQALCEAVYSSHYECVRLLLADGPIDEENRGCFVRQAASTTNPGILRLLLKHGPILESWRGQAVERAAHENHHECVSLLLANGPISDEMRQRALMHAGRHNNEELIQLLGRDTGLIFRMNLAPLDIIVNFPLKAQIAIGKLLLPSWKTVTRVAFTALTGINIFRS